MTEPAPKRDDEAATPQARPLWLRHFRTGWATLIAFAALGIALDTMHAFKVPFYLDVDVEARRLMWTLSHAHGVGLALLHMGVGATLKARAALETAQVRRGSACLTIATVLIPLGFFLGGIVVHGGDPSAGVLLVPIGGLVLFAGVVLVGLSVLRTGDAGATD